MPLSAAHRRARLAGILVLGSTTLLGSCQTHANGGIGYQLIGSEIVTDRASGDSKRIRHWRYQDGSTTQSVDPALLVGNQTHRGEKVHPH